VSATKGSDLSQCGTLASPCRTFQYTHDNIVAAGGEIRVRDPGEYSPLTIRKSISIVNDGVGVAGISVVGAGTGISVQAGPTDKVFIKGLTIIGESGAGDFGIYVSTAGNFTLTNCRIGGFAGQYYGAGLYMPASPVRISISNSIIYGNNYGIYIDHGTNVAYVRGVISGVDLTNNYSGMAFGGFSNIVLSEVNIIQNIPNPQQLYFPLQIMGNIYMTRSVLAGSDGGVDVSLPEPGVLNSYGDNVVGAIQSELNSVYNVVSLK
jgi:hypothetical protein